MKCPICNKGTETDNLISHVRHKHTDYDQALEAARGVSHIVHNRLRKEYNEIARKMLEEKTCKTMIDAKS